MTEIPQGWSPPADAPKTGTLDEVLTKWERDYTESLPGSMDPPSKAGMAALRERLYAREDNMADVIRLAGVQFNLFPEVVAEVLAEVGLGTPIDDDQRMFVRRQFVALMERLRAEFGTPE